MQERSILYIFQRKPNLSPTQNLSSYELFVAVLYCLVQVGTPSFMLMILSRGLKYNSSVSFYLSLDSVKLHYPATNKKKRMEYMLMTILPSQNRDITKKENFIY
jgi:hypothetical protein